MVQCAGVFSLALPPPGSWLAPGAYGRPVVGFSSVRRELISLLAWLKPGRASKLLRRWNRFGKRPSGAKLETWGQSRVSVGSGGVVGGVLKSNHRSGAMLAM